MNNRVPYNTATGRAFYNPATGRAIYIDQHVISAFSGSITFEYGDPEDPSIMTCYEELGVPTDFGFNYTNDVKTGLILARNKVTASYSPDPFLSHGYSLEYLPSSNRLRFSFIRTDDFSIIPHNGWKYVWTYTGYFGQSTPTVGMAGVYDTVVSQSCDYLTYAHSVLIPGTWSQTTDQTFAFTLALQ